MIWLLTEEAECVSERQRWPQGERLCLRGSEAEAQGERLCLRGSEAEAQGKRLCLCFTCWFVVLLRLIIGY